MPDRVLLTLRTAIASNTGGPYTATWDRAVVPFSGTIRGVYAVAPSITSNTRQNTVEIYLQPNAPTGGSNTAATVLTDPITLPLNNVAVGGTIRAGNARVAAGEHLQLRTDAANIGAQPAFLNLAATVEIERD